MTQGCKITGPSPERLSAEILSWSCRCVTADERSTVMLARFDLGTLCLVWCPTSASTCSLSSNILAWKSSRLWTQSRALGPRAGLGPSERETPFHSVQTGRLYTNKNMIICFHTGNERGERALLRCKCGKMMCDSGSILPCIPMSAHFPIALLSCP